MKQVSRLIIIRTSLIRENLVLLRNSLFEVSFSTLGEKILDFNIFLFVYEEVYEELLLSIPILLSVLNMPKL